MMKQCCNCKEEKPLDAFNKNKARKDNLNTICRDCSKKRSKQYYKENKEHHKKQVAERNKRVRAERSKKRFEFLNEAECEICGFEDWRALEFDHIDPSSKTASISNMMINHEWATILEEIAKCRVLCANCHRIHTRSQQGWYEGV